MTTQFNTKTFSVRFKNSRSDPSETAFTVKAEHIRMVSKSITDTYPSAVCIRIFLTGGYPYGQL